MGRWNSQPLLSFRSKNTHILSWFLPLQLTHTKDFLYAGMICSVWIRLSNILQCKHSCKTAKWSLQQSPKTFPAYNLYMQSNIIAENMTSQLNSDIFGTYSVSKSHQKKGKFCPAFHIHQGREPLLLANCFFVFNSLILCLVGRPYNYFVFSFCEIS